MSNRRTDPLDLIATGSLIGGHVAAEEALFRLCGAWSTDPATASGPFGAEIQELMATQAALHAWRAEQWSARLPRSVPAEVTLPDGWSRATALCRDRSDGTERLACWAVALAPGLAARYRSHESGLSPAADSGVRRWLRMAIEDVQRSGVDAVELLGRTMRSTADGGVPDSSALAAVPAVLAATMS